LVERASLLRFTRTLSVLCLLCVVYGATSVTDRSLFHRIPTHRVCLFVCVIVRDRLCAYTYVCEFMCLIMIVQLCVFVCHQLFVSNFVSNLFVSIWVVVILCVYLCLFFCDYMYVSVCVFPIEFAKVCEAETTQWSGV
jgi:hypothetical protein